MKIKGWTFRVRGGEVIYIERDGGIIISEGGVTFNQREREKHPKIILHF